MDKAGTRSDKGKGNSQRKKVSSTSLPSMKVPKIPKAARRSSGDAGKIPRAYKYAAGNMMPDYTMMDIPKDDGSGFRSVGIQVSLPPPKDEEILAPTKKAGKSNKDALRKKKRSSRDSTVKHSILDTSRDGSGTRSIKVSLPRTTELEKYLEIVRAGEAKRKLAEEALRKKRRSSRDSTVKHSILDTSRDGSGTRSIKVSLPRTTELEKYLEIVRAGEAKRKLAEEALRKKRRSSRDSTVKHSILDTSRDGSGTRSIKVSLPRTTELEKDLEIVRAGEAKRKLAEEALRKKRRSSRDSTVKHSILDTSRDGSGTRSIKVSLPRTTELEKYLEIVRAGEAKRKLAEEALRKKRRSSRDSTVKHSILDTSRDGSGTRSIKVSLPRTKELDKYLEIVRVKEAKRKLAERNSGGSQEELGELAEGSTPFVSKICNPQRSEEWWARYEFVVTPILIIDSEDER